MKTFQKIAYKKEAKSLIRHSVHVSDVTQVLEKVKFVKEYWQTLGANKTIPELPDNIETILQVRDELNENYYKIKKVIDFPLATKFEDLLVQLKSLKKKGDSILQAAKNGDLVELIRGSELNKLWKNSIRKNLSINDFKLVINFVISRNIYAYLILETPQILENKKYNKLIKNYIELDRKHINNL